MGIHTWFVAAAVVIGAAQAPTRPRVTPLFSGDGLPRFSLECTNGGADLARPGSGTSVRLDGVPLLPNRGQGIYIGTGGNPIPTGGSWQEVVTLRPSADLLAPPLRLSLIGSPGFQVQAEHPVSLTSGQHRVSFQCGGEWSEDIVFLWFAPKG
jgi:hypothetical protein